MTMKIQTEDYTPDNYKEYLSNNLFHHKDKGCEFEIRIHKGSDKNYAYEKFCKTHNVLCSKTGWELGYYMGTKTKKLPSDYYCEDCGCLIKSVNRKFYCDHCLEKRKQERIIKNKANKLILQNKAREERLRQSMIKKEINRLKINSKKLNDILGYINEYQKADYSERITNKQYNDLVEKADKIIVRKLNNRNKLLAC